LNKIMHVHFAWHSQQDCSLILSIEISCIDMKYWIARDLAFQTFWWRALLKRNYFPKCASTALKLVYIDV